jgi:PadR family transcriptional regulator, regulatory protein PadR
MYTCIMNSTELIKGTLTTILLKLLDENGKMYGYEITQKVKELSDNKILIKEGSLYPALHKLLIDGLVEVETVNVGKRIRKYYSITKQGKERKIVLYNELREFIKTIQHIVFPHQKVSFL